VRPGPPSALVALICVTALIGCGADETTPTSTAAEPTSADTTLVAALGDSITAGSPLWDPDPAIRARIGPALDERSQFEYWLERDDPTVEYRNCGVFGERTDEIAQRLEVCVDGADALIVQGGINDIAQARPAADAADDLQSMVRAALDLGVPVALVDVLPWSNGHPAADAPIAELNREIERIGVEEDVPVLPFHDTLEDPAEPGTMAPGLTNDGDHPSIAGYRLLAEQAFADFP